MRRLFRPITNLMLFDFKKLLVLEILIKLIGIAVIFPIFRLGFYFSLKFSGLKYISNNDLLLFIKKPATILIFIFLLIVFALYIVLEYVFLVILYENSHKKQKMTYRTFFNTGLKKYFQTLKKYHIVILVSIPLFFLVFEYAQFIFLSSTLKIPTEIVLQIKTLEYFNLIFIISFIALVVFFIELIFMTHSFVINNSSIKSSFSHSRNILSKSRLKLLFRFILFNLIANIFMILFYALIVFFIGLFVLFFRGEQVVYGLIITSMYSLFFIIRIIFTSVIFPLNIAIASDRYYQVNSIKSIDISKPEEKTDIKLNFKKILKPALLVFIFVFSLNIVTIIDSIKNTQENFQVFKQEEIIAHRGASLDAPENTLAALDLAIIQGSDAIEFDVRATKDHVPILLHDETLYRTTSFTAGNKVSDLKYETIKDLDAGSWFSEDFKEEKIPTLEEAFELVAGRTNVFLDLKTNDILAELEILRLIREYNMEDSIKIMSFDVSQLERLKQANPNLETILLIAVFYGNINNLIANESIDHFALRTSVIERYPDIIRQIHAGGKKGYAWVVDDQASINQGIRADVDGFITKRPIEAREIAYSKNSSDTFKYFLQNLFK